ncbi:MAG TPA: DoxX family protein [Terriglobales bacterium]|nr:DoxX family protein [Terriglobales bacterium]
MSQPAPKTIALMRMLTGVFFLLFGEYKVASGGFAHGGFQNYLNDYITHDAVAFYRPILSRLVLPHAVLLGYCVGIVELLIAASLLLGWRVRFFSVVGVLYMINLTLATWNAPGPGAVWRYFGNELDHIPLLFLFMIFFATRAGETWGLDARSGRAPRPKAARA